MSVVLLILQMSYKYIELFSLHLSNTMSNVKENFKKRIFLMITSIIFMKSLINKLRKAWEIKIFPHNFLTGRTNFSQLILKFQLVGAHQFHLFTLLESMLRRDVSFANLTRQSPLKEGNRLHTRSNMESFRYTVTATLSLRYSRSKGI